MFKSATFKGQPELSIHGFGLSFKSNVMIDRKKSKAWERRKDRVEQKERMDGKEGLGAGRGRFPTRVSKRHLCLGRTEG